MSDIPKQTYKPNQWVRFNYGNNGQGVSQVRSASFIKGKGWMYIVDNPMDPKSTMYIAEKDIIEEAESA